MVVVGKGKRRECKDCELSSQKKTASYAKVDKMAYQHEHTRVVNAYLALRCAMEAHAPAAIAGAMDVVKMKPEAKERIASTMAAEPAT